MNDCIFCKIVKGEIPSFKIYEDENYLAFLDISNFVEGHTLVIPKKHYRFIWDMDDLGEYWNVIRKICRHYTDDLGFKYIDTLTFGRMIPHVHVHILPHNDDNPEWKSALEKIGEMQKDESRRLDQKRGSKIASKFALK